MIGRWPAHAGDAFGAFEAQGLVQAKRVVVGVRREHEMLGAKMLSGMMRDLHDKA
jgi:hypothetical protein